MMSEILPLPPNTINTTATINNHGKRVDVSGPITATAGERVTLPVDGGWTAGEPALPW